MKKVLLLLSLLIITGCTTDIGSFSNEEIESAINSDSAKQAVQEIKQKIQDEEIKLDEEITQEIVEVTKTITKTPEPVVKKEIQIVEEAQPIIQVVEKITESIVQEIIYEESEPIQLPAVENNYCCKYCSKGKACGDSCISRSYTCHKAPGCACNS